MNGIENKRRVRPSFWLIIFALVFSIVGLTDSIYLTLKHYTHSDINCSILEGCNVVTTSVYSIILDIPVAVLGVIFYTLIFAAILLFVKTNNKKYLISFFTISSIGFLASIWFVYVQVFVLETLCLYCIASAGISTTLFIASLLMMIQYKKKNILNY